MGGFGGRKFHLRLYVHVPRWSPVGALLYDDGMVFRSRHAYEGHRPSTKNDVFSGVSQDVEPLALTTLWDALGSMVAAKVRTRIVDLLANIFGVAVEETFGDASDLNKRGFACFDLFGVDVMLDE